MTRTVNQPRLVNELIESCYRVLEQADWLITNEYEVNRKVVTPYRWSRSISAGVRCTIQAIKLMSRGVLGEAAIILRAW